MTRGGPDGEKFGAQASEGGILAFDGNLDVRRLGKEMQGLGGLCFGPSRPGIAASETSSFSEFPWSRCDLRRCTLR